MKKLLMEVFAAGGRTGLVGMALRVAATIALLVTSWEAYSYRHRLNEYAHNDQWEERLSREHVYDSQRIVFFGDSQLAYWPMAESFGALPIVNRGVPGDFAADAVSRFERDALALAPAIVVILIGTNDLGHNRSLNEIVGNIENMMTRAEQRSIHVVLCGLLPTAREYSESRPTRQILAMNTKLRMLAAKHGAEFVDFFHLLTNSKGQFEESFTVDGLHPNRSGYIRMAHKILRVISRNLGIVNERNTLLPAFARANSDGRSE